ncbi:Transmembrane channel-like protein 3 [Amphibalanus amphitrite]|uniref:Transmembrane channel-like protein 3 n=1 Tax=Amphibalanus amphitrite TaxID=1232801 RepID=A0A6A4VIU8_AMPAM|nr:Transmembrane channel-like protein 3 [Amphibalanus amphitrite]
MLNEGPNKVLFRSQEFFFQQTKWGRFNPVCGALPAVGAEEEEDDEYSASVSQILERHGSRRGSRRLQRQASSRDSRRSLRRRRSRGSKSHSAASGDVVVEVEESDNEEQIFENIRLHKEVIGEIKHQPWPMQRKLNLVTQAKIYVAKHEGELAERLAQSRSARDILARYSLVFLRYWQVFQREFANFVTSAVPWQKPIKRIESHFGTAVASYFTFLRWILFMNIGISVLLVCFVIIPEILAADRHDLGERKELLEVEKKHAYDLKTIWDFEGILKYSPIFYGYYNNKDKTSAGYRIPFAYFLSGMIVYAFSFIVILKKMAENSRMSKMSSKEDDCAFTWKLFTGWDFMIGHAETALNKVSSITLGFRESLLEERERAKEEISWRTIALRVLANLSVLLLLVGSAYAVILLVQRSTEPEATSWYRQNELTLVMTLISNVFPTLFDKLGLLEGYHPRQQLRMQLARIMALNLLNLYTLIFALFGRVDDITAELTALKPNFSSVPPQLSAVAADFLRENPTETTALPHPCYGMVINCTALRLEVANGSFLDLPTTTAAPAAASWTTPTSTHHTWTASSAGPAGAAPTAASSLPPTPSSYRPTEASPSTTTDQPQISVQTQTPTEVPHPSTTDGSASLSTHPYPTRDSSAPTSVAPTGSDLTDLWVPRWRAAAAAAGELDWPAGRQPSTDGPYGPALSSGTIPPEMTIPLDGRGAGADRGQRDRRPAGLGASTVLDSGYRSGDTSSVRSERQVTESGLTIADDLTGGPPFDGSVFLEYAGDGTELSRPSVSGAAQTESATGPGGRTSGPEGSTTGPGSSTSGRTTGTEGSTSGPGSSTSGRTTGTEGSTSGSATGTEGSTSGPGGRTSGPEGSTTGPGSSTSGRTTGTEGSTSGSATGSEGSTSGPEGSTTGPGSSTTEDAEAAPAGTEESGAAGPAGPVPDQARVHGAGPTIESTSAELAASGATTAGGAASPSAEESELWAAATVPVTEMTPSAAECYRFLCADNDTDYSEPPSEDGPTTPGGGETATDVAVIRETARIFNSTVRLQLRKLCWETMYGQELVKLIIMDTVWTVASVVGMEFLRALFVRVMNNCWCWDLERTAPKYADFSIAENILHLVNNQGMVWMGMFFAPGLPAINAVKLVILMYVRAWGVLTSNVPHEVIFKASRSNNFYFALLLIMLFLCTLPVGYAIVWLEPSWHCGPFSGYLRAYKIFTNGLQRALPDSLNKILDYISSPAIVIPLLVLLVLVIFYQISLAGSLRESNNDLRNQLRRERTEERRKMFKMADAKTKEPEKPFDKWSRLLENTFAKPKADDATKPPRTQKEKEARAKELLLEAVHRRRERIASQRSEQSAQGQPQPAAPPPAKARRAKGRDKQKDKDKPSRAEKGRGDSRGKSGSVEADQGAAKRDSTASSMSVPVIRISKEDSVELVDEQTAEPAARRGDGAAGEPPNQEGRVAEGGAAPAPAQRRGPARSVSIESRPVTPASLHGSPCLSHIDSESTRSTDSPPDSPLGSLGC